MVRCSDGVRKTLLLARASSIPSSNCRAAMRQRRTHCAPISARKEYLPNWMLYVAVENADQSAAKVKQLGGKVIVEPFNVKDFGRMAVIQDPTGAHFCIWQALKHPGIGIADVAGTLCWGDLSTPDPKLAEAFYAGLFGCQLILDEKDSSGYLHIKNGEQFIGGIPPAQHRQPGVPPHWLAYFLVDDVDAIAAQAKHMGSNLCLPPMTMEKVGRMSVIGDPQGAVFAIFKSAR